MVDTDARHAAIHWPWPGGTLMPQPYDPPPIGCTKAMLTAWLAQRHGMFFPSTWTVAQIIAPIEAIYPPHIVVCSRPEGGTPATWDVWNFVVKHSKRVAGGQQSLFGELDDY